ncbi:phosphoenolpyruvate-utilizing N-terminal domain-containing protein [Pontiella sulfatireligans]|uniref:Phosphotransferase system enzyme I N-terminal domain-containing protein n=1 Tax=Pontiella sulfatireligans TaxID=2750658 RepID=A0A6C2UIB1_9BACT|nr:phosphoenolpyruvate-utilizing N-terminal domain-containing protein [Pontiella sulfatireligans]VGO19930.1 hypothetical protein SCARR_01990 [Pontiella sulfatireligans]
MTAPSDRLGKSDRSIQEVVLHGTSICPGISIGQVHLLDADIPIPQNPIDAEQIAPEQERYTLPIDSAKRYLRDHVANVHADSSTKAQAIFEIHQVILADESFHDQVPTP